MREVWFRISLILVFTSLSAMRAVCKRRADAAGEGLFPKQEGVLLNGIRGVLCIPLFGMFFLYLVVPGTPPWAFVRVHTAVRLGGVAGGISALVVIGLSHRALGESYSSMISLRENHRLVTGGVYRVVRHPMYGAYLLLFLCAFLISGNWVIGASGGGIILSLMTIRLAREEAVLEERYGGEYRAYMQRTGRFLPFPKQGRGKCSHDDPGTAARSEAGESG